MNFNMKAGVFAAAMSKVSSVVEARSTIPILSNCLVTASDAGVVVKGTDLDIEVSVSIDAAVEAPGSLCVSTDRIHSYVSKLVKTADVTMGSAPGAATLRQGRSSIRLLSLPADDFPLMQGEEFPHRFDMKGTDLARILGDVRFAMSKEASRYYLGGAYLHGTRTGASCAIVVCATDGHRLSVSDIDVGARPVDHYPGIIIPRKTVDFIAAIAADVETVTVSYSVSKITFDLGRITVTSKLIDGTFPDYHRVIPASPPLVARMRRQVVSAVVDRVTTVQTEKGSAVKLSLSPGTLLVESSSPDHGNASEDVDIAYYGPEVKLAVNSRYLSEVLAAIKTDDIEMGITDAGAPIVITDGVHFGRKVVVMPMRA